MDVSMIVLLVSVGLLGGFIGGLIGLGGGVIFAPVLLVFYQSLGVPEAIITPLTLGTSSFCVLIATGASAVAQHKKQMIHWKTATYTGIFGGVVMYAMIQLVSTQAWYDKKSFQLIFSFILFWVTIRMLLANEEHSETEVRTAIPTMFGIGFMSGTASALAGVGGGVILVPAFNRLLKFPLKNASASSNGTIVYTSLIGIVGYLISGWGKVTFFPYTLGYIDLLHGLFIAIPTLFSAKWGVEVAQRLDTTWLRRIFALLAFVLAIRLAWSALS